VNAAEPPRPLRVAPVDDGRLVPPGWLDQAPVTRTLLAINVAVFLAQEAASAHHGLFAGFETSQLLRFGASYPLATIGENRWETLVTACFLHGGLLHLGFNMLALWQAGPLVERAVGSARMAPMYLLSGACGNLLSVASGWLKRTGAPTVGASGAILGVVAAALVIGWRIQGWRGPLTQAMARWIGFVIAFGLLSGGVIDNWAHVGGALAGAVIASMWRRGYRYSVGATRAILGACLLVLLLCIGVVAWRDSTDRFAAMGLLQRFDFARDALGDQRCRDAHDGLLAVERLRPNMVQVPSLRVQVDKICGL
jgi:rhomboid protease GluP